MSTADFFTTPGVAGLFMLWSILVMLAAFGLIPLQGRLRDLVAGFGGLDPETGDASGLRKVGHAASPYTIAQLAGFTLLAEVRAQAGDRGSPVGALVFLVSWSVLGAVEGSFHLSETVWAKE